MQQNPTATPREIAVAKGDGIGPEIMDAVLHILQASGANLTFTEVHIGLDEYNKNPASLGLPEEALAEIRRIGILLKSPLSTPERDPVTGESMKSVNVLLRQKLGLFANVRPVQSYTPFVPSPLALDKNFSLTIVRENSEDLYVGQEAQLSADTVVADKLVTRAAWERITRFAAEYAQSHGLDLVTLMGKWNIQQMADGLMLDVFNKTAPDYAGVLEFAKRIVDIGFAEVAGKPHQFKVVLASNLYGDIVSDIAAIAANNSLGLSPSSNIGYEAAMYEAIHGTAPDIAGKGFANPSALLLAAVMMLRDIGEGEIATTIHNAWLATIEEGIHTGDIYREGKSAKRVGTQEFAEAVIARLGKAPTLLDAVDYTGEAQGTNWQATVQTRKLPSPAKALLEGVDISIDWPGNDPQTLADAILRQTGNALALEEITKLNNARWRKDGGSIAITEENTSSVWKCRFRFAEGCPPDFSQILELQKRLYENEGLEIVRSTALRSFEGAAGYTRANG